MHWILDLDILLLVSGIARKHGILQKPFLGCPQYFPPPKKNHFLPRTRDFLRKRVRGFSNWQLQENMFNRANLFGGATLCSSYLTPQIQCLPASFAWIWSSQFFGCAVHFNPRNVDFISGPSSCENQPWFSWLTVKLLSLLQVKIGLIRNLLFVAYSILLGCYVLWPSLQLL